MQATAISPKLSNLISYVVQDFDMEIRTEYSGRGMYGATCFGLVFDGTPGQFFAAFVQCMEGADFELYQQVADLFDQMETDSLGWDTIYYFPGWCMDEE